MIRHSTGGDGFRARSGLHPPQNTHISNHVELLLRKTGVTSEAPLPARQACHDTGRTVLALDDAHTRTEHALYTALWNLGGAIAGSVPRTSDRVPPRPQSKRNLQRLTEFAAGGS
jgi:hypothetical protein